MKEKINTLIEAGRREEAIRLLEDYLQTTADEELLLKLGELWYAQGNMTFALNKFNAVLRQNPRNKVAENYVTMILNILNYFNKDLLNP